MLRRRLVMNSSSDEEEDEPTIPNQQTPSVSPRSNPNPNRNHTLNHPSDQPLPISDDDDDGDFSDNLSPPVPESPGGCPISEHLQGLGLRLRREWLDSCVRGLEQSVPGFDDLEVGVKSKLCFEKFLVSDMNFSGGGVLPRDLDSLHLVDLPGPFVLQVDEIVNLSSPLKGRYQKAPPGVKRCLKLSLTDGFRRAFAMEYRPVKDLDVLAPAGLKVIICNVHIRHGLLMLVPEAIEVLGGLVEELEAARQRLVEEVNKPPRGIRSRNRVVAPLRDRATLAAWNGDHVAEGNNDAIPEHTNPPQVHPQGGTTGVGLGNDADRRIEEEFPGIISEESVIRNPSSKAVRMSVEELPVRGDEERTIPSPSADVVMGLAEATLGADDDDVHMYTIPDSRANAVPYSSSGIASVVEDTPSVVEDTEMDTIAASTSNLISEPSLNTIRNDEEVSNPISDPPLSNIPNDDEVLEVEHPLLLSGSRESPFTYMASLSAKWTSMKESTDSVKGIIKCFLTGVKGFQFKYRPTYDLQVYVDDGSLICEILIHHGLVQKMVGYTPQEVTEAVNSSDTARSNKMRETMKQFQSFLVNFEGKMLVEMNKTSSLPVALEMTPGCSESDAMLLLRRVKSSVQPQKHPPPSNDPICLSP